MSHLRPTITEATEYAKSYIKKNCQTTAFKAAFPGSKMKGSNLHKIASKVHKTSEVQARIDQLEAASAKQSEEEFCLSVSQKKRILAEVIKIGMNKDEKLDKPQLGDVVRAINEMNKMDGSHAAEKRTVGGDKANPLQILVGQISGATLEPGQILEDDL